MSTTAKHYIDKLGLGTEHMDEAYHQKRYHFVQSCWGMLIGLIPCLIGAGL